MNAVLLVDDERDFAEMLARRLAGRGFSVRTAASGEEALSLAAGAEPEVAVLDVGLPGMDGLTLLGRLKRLHPAVEALMLTGSNDLTTAVAGMKLGAADYLVKPVPIGRLVEAISRALARRRGRLEALRVAETAKLAALGRMAEGMAHEINNPVNTMVSLAGWLGDLAADLRTAISSAPRGKAQMLLAEMEASAAKLAGQARRVKAVTADLLCLCGRCRTQDGPPGGGRRADLPRLLDGLLAVRRKRMAAAGVRFEAHFAAGLPPLVLPGGLPSGAPPRGADLETALGNILDNALDAMPQGGVLTVSACAGREGLARIVIADTGPGIAPEILPRVFEPFFSTREVGRGTGLGLTVSYGTLQALGGDVQIESAPGGRGTRVLVTLPFGEEAPRETAAAPD